ncbi:huntingtin-interacting protein 1-like [Salarias fasciatus]|uniref:huntingtin-interacting protein 1-like n=1 Tax=Salarias fasciatus TaxID=181472 RepID=UPI001176639C|nr:huntingtin-interacting protein 1-like [Salarias fasciatus]
MFDYLECELNLFLGVFSSLDMSRSVSVTAAGQCRLAPLIQVILDCSHLYDYTVKLLFKLHSCLPADTLQGHRDRFQEQFKKLKSLFYRSSNLQYFKRLIQIPQLPELERIKGYRDVSCGGISVTFTVGKHVCHLLSLPSGSPLSAGQSRVGKSNNAKVTAAKGLTPDSSA